MPHAGSLSDRITFYRRVIDRSNPDDVRINWIPDTPPIWAAAVQRTAEMSCQFVIHYRSDVTPASHRIVWENRIWTIVNAIHDPRRRQLTIDADISNLVEVTDLSSIDREYLDMVPALRPPV